MRSYILLQRSWSKQESVRALQPHNIAVNVSAQHQWIERALCDVAVVDNLPWIPGAGATPAEGSV